MALDHFSIWHFKAGHFTTFWAGVGGAVTAAFDWLITARRRHGR